MPSMTPDTNHTLSVITGGTERTGLTWYRMVNGTPTKILWGGEAPPAPSYTPNPSNGTNGPLTDTQANTLAVGSVSSVYHVRASHLTGPGPYPLIIHLHGDGYEEYTHMAAGTANSVANHYAQVAKDTGALFVLPRTPDTTSGTWWEKTSSTTWLMGLYTNIISRYNVDLNQVYWSGYSGGAEEITYNITADYHAQFTGGGAMILGGGGADGLTGFNGTPTTAFKANYPMRWYIGALDTDDGTGWSAVADSAVGEKWYRDRGFTTSRTLIPGATHVPTEPYGPHYLQDLIREGQTRIGAGTPTNYARVTPAATRSTTLTTTATRTLPAPASTTGDLILITLALSGSGVANAALPAGFTKIGDRSIGTTRRLVIGYKTAATEPANYTPTIPTGITVRADLTTFKGTTGAPTAVIAQTAAAATHAAPAITPTSTSGALINIITGPNTNTWTPDDWTVELTDASGTGLSLSTAYQPIKTTNPTGTRTFTASTGSAAHLTATVYIPARAA